MTPSRIHRLSADAFPQLPRGEPRDARRDGGAGRPERRRQDQLPGGDLVSVAGTRPAPRHAGGCRRQPGRRLLGGVGRGRRRAGARHARHRHRCRRPARRPATTRRCRIDREPVGSATAFGDHLRMVWLTPAMDGLFLGAASERRRFFDRLVLAIDSEHSSRVSALDRSLRSRNRLLEVRNYDDHWCDAIERETAELAVAVAATRGQTATKLAGDACARAARLPRFRPPGSCSTAGWRTRLIAEPATAVEDRYRADPARQPRPRRRRRPHARRPASHRPAGDLRAEEHAGARRLDRRAEGAADRAGAGACQPGRGDDRHHAAVAARRSGGASRSRRGAAPCSTNLPNSARRSG